MIIREYKNCKYYTGFLGNVICYVLNIKKNIIVTLG